MVVCPACRASYPDAVSECPADGSALLPSEAFADADVPLEPGAMVGEYRVDRKLGAGSFGAVYAGEQPLIGKRVAVKVLHRKLSSDPEAVSRFIAEARAVNRIRRRNLIDIFSFGLLPNRQHYFVMELLDGLTLGELLDREGRLSVARALPILRGIADGLDAAHAAQVTHRDLKPDNVFLAVEKDGGYFPKLLDFGVAKLLSEDMAHKTATGAAIGTPRDMSPEQCRGKKVDHRSDIYALGVVIHEMLTGECPFEGSSVVDLLFQHTTDPPPPMSKMCPELPPELDAPVLEMLAKRPGARPSSAGQAVAALAERARSLGLDVEEAPATPAPDALARGAPGLAWNPLSGATIRKDRADAAPPGAPGPHAATAAVRKAAGAEEEAEDDKGEEEALASRTLEVPRSPAGGALIAAPPTAEVRSASDQAAAAPPDVAVGRSAAGADLRPGAPRAVRSSALWALAAVGAAVAALAVFALLRGDPAPAPDASAAPELVPAPGANTGEASSPSILPDRVQDRLPLALTTTAAATPPAPPPATATAKQPRKPAHNTDLERPAELDKPAPKRAP